MNINNDRKTFLEYFFAYLERGIDDYHDVLEQSAEELIKASRQRGLTQVCSPCKAAGLILSAGNPNSTSDVILTPTIGDPLVTCYRKSQKNTQKLRNRGEWH